jgi:hypothetical protein
LERPVRALQGGEKLSKLDADARTELFQQSGRDEKSPLNPQLPAVTTAQELTEEENRKLNRWSRA